MCVRIKAHTLSVHMIKFLPPANSWRKALYLHVCRLLILFWIHHSFRVIKSRHIVLHLVIKSCFGSFRSIWPMLHSCFIRTAPGFIWKWTESHVFCLVRTRFRMAAFTLTQMNRTNRAIAPEFVLFEPNMTSVNTPLVTYLQSFDLLRTGK